MYRVIWCFWRRDVKRHPHSHQHAAVRKNGTITNAVSMSGQRRRLWFNIETALDECHVFVQSIQQTQRRRRLTSIDPAMGWPNIEPEFGG